MGKIFQLQSNHFLATVYIKLFSAAAFVFLRAFSAKLFSSGQRQIQRASANATHELYTQSPAVQIHGWSTTLNCLGLIVDLAVIIAYVFSNKFVPKSTEFSREGIIARRGTIVPLRGYFGLSEDRKV